MLEGIILGVDGVLAETHEVRREAFNKAFNDGCIDWRWGRTLYGELLKMSSGHDMVDAFIAIQFPHWRRTDDLSKLAAAINRRQTSICRQQFESGSVRLRPGMSDLIQAAARTGVRLAVATNEDASEVASLLRTNLASAARRCIEVISTRSPADADRPTSAHSLALEAISLDPTSCLAVESSAAGVRSAAEAGIPTAITAGIYSQLQDCCDLLAADARVAGASSTIHAPLGAVSPTHLLAELRRVHATKTAASDAIASSRAVSRAVRRLEFAHASG